MSSTHPVQADRRFHLRYRITSALVAVLVFAVGFAALRESDELWDCWLFSLTLGFLMFAVLLAVYRKGDRRAFWIGFALFGWGYLSLSLIPSIKPRLISTKALAFLHQSNMIGSRAYEMRAILALDRMLAHNLSEDDLKEALKETGMMGLRGALGGRTDNTSITVVDHVLSWRARYNEPDSYENLIILAYPQGEILRLKDVAKVELGTSRTVAGFWSGTVDTFMDIGHSLVALLTAWLGGLLSRRLGRVSVAPEMPFYGSTSNQTGD